MKKHCILLFSALILSAPFVAAQTTVSGFINANTTWTLAGSPYLVTGNALLSQGFTLTIDPGVVVKFGTNNALQIDGQLIAIGTPTQRIIFTSNQSNPQPGDWAKLHFSDFSVDAVYNAQGNYVSGTIMKYCDVLYGGSLMWGSIDIQDCSPYLNHCRIALGSWCGINFNGDHLTIDSSRITDLPKRGIYFVGGWYTLRNDTFITCAEGAIHVAGLMTTAQSRITDSYFKWNYGVLSGGFSVTVLNSTFVYNAGPAVLSIGGWNDTISCNRFAYNALGPVIESQGTTTSGSIVIYNNIIEYNVNSNPSSWNGASVFYIGVNGYDTVSIANNTIRHNSSPGRSCCTFNVAFTGAQNTLQMYNNECTENDGANFMIFYGPQNNNPTFDFMNLDSNTFINPLCTYELNNNIPYGAPNLYPANNYWGGSTSQFVEGRIYDYFDFANQSVVYYMPFLAGPTQIDTLCQAFAPMGVTQLHSIVQNPVNLYPNPTNDNVTITFAEEIQSSGGTVEVLNPLSEVVYCEPLNGTASNSIVLPEASGIYIIRVITKDNIWVGKIVKE